MLCPGLRDHPLGCSALTQNWSPNPLHFAFDPAALPVFPYHCACQLSQFQKWSLFSLPKCLGVLDLIALTCKCKTRRDKTCKTPASYKKADKWTINVQCCYSYTLHPSLNFCILVEGCLFSFFKCHKQGVTSLNFLRLHSSQTSCGWKVR